MPDGTEDEWADGDFRRADAREWADQDWVLRLEPEFGRRVRDARMRQGMSQQHIAITMSMLYGLNWHQTTVAKIEAGARPIRLSEAAGLSIVLGVPLAELLYEDPAAEPRRGAEEEAALQELRRLQSYMQQRFAELRGGGGGSGGEHRQATP